MYLFKKIRINGSIVTVSRFISNYQNESKTNPAVFIIGKPTVGKTSLTIPIAERYNFYPVHIRHYVDALSRQEILNYFLSSIKKPEINSKLKLMLRNEQAVLDDQRKHSLVRGRAGIKRRIELNNLLKSIDINAEEHLKEALKSFPDQFKYTNIYSKHQMQTKSSNLLANEVVCELLDKILENVCFKFIKNIRGVVLDGYPLSVNQAELAINICQKYNFRPVFALEVDIPDEELLENVHQTPKSNNALLTLDDKDPRYNLDVLRERLSIFYANIDETKKFFSKKNIDVYKLRVPNTQNTYISDQNVFNITDKLIRNYSNSIELCKNQ